MYDDTVCRESLCKSSDFFNDLPKEINEYVFLDILEHNCIRPYLLREAIDEGVFLKNTPFVYDRVTNLVFGGGFGVHEMLAAKLWYLRKEFINHLGRDSYDAYTVVADNRETFAERYLNAGMGFLSSGVSSSLNRKILTVGSNVKLNHKEQRIFEDYKLDRI